MKPSELFEALHVLITEHVPLYIWGLGSAISRDLIFCRMLVMQHDDGSWIGGVLRTIHWQTCLVSGIQPRSTLFARRGGLNLRSQNNATQRHLLNEGLSGEVEVDGRCLSFHEADARALSEGLEIPNDFAIWANNLSKDCTVPPGDTCTV